MISADVPQSGKGCRTLFDHLLNGARRIDLHSGEVFEAVHFRSILRELLAECIGEVVCRIR